MFFMNIIGLKKYIERIVCSGGGAKGIVYPGAYQAMIDTGLFNQVKEISGVSAGAISATFMALGIRPLSYRRLLFKTNLNDLMGEKIGRFFRKNTPGVSCITKDGKALEDFLRYHIAKTIKATILSLALDKEAKLDEDLKKILEKLKETQPCIRFKDLAILAQHFPHSFRQLNISAIKFPTGELQVFNSELTPDVEIALACRASASIPVLLQPISLAINEKTEIFLDGGLYENLPTDYFDLQQDHTFEKNTKREQTLVFAFGEGLDNNQNPVFQALYGQRWNEVINEEILSELIQEVIKERPVSKHLIEAILAKKIKEKRMTTEEAKILREGMIACLHEEKVQRNEIKKLVYAVKQKLTPILYKVSIFEKLIRDNFVKFFGNLLIPYKNTEQKEIGYQKLRSDYTLRTVELRVGNIKTSHFTQAMKVARTMYSLGYFDTINYITNHELHQSEMFNSDEFYTNIVSNFSSIYYAVLAGSGKKLKENEFIQSIKHLREKLYKENKSTAVISRQVYQLIKDKVERNLDSIEAFALSRAIEFHGKILKAEELFKEVYEEAFKRSGLFAVSKIMGKSYYTSTCLHDRLKHKNMFQLFHNKPTNPNTRIAKVYAYLKNLACFNEESASFSC